MSTPRICVAGSLNMDLIAYVGTIPPEASYTADARFESHAGGKSLNVAMSMAAFDPSVKLIGRIGRDIFGEEIFATIAQSGMSTTHIAVDQIAHTGIGHVRINADGEYDTAVAAGANANFSKHDIDAYLASSEAPAFVVLNLEIPPESVRYAAEMFRRGGSRIVLNVSPLRVDARSFLKLADILVLNLSEACSILGVDSKTDPRWIVGELRRASSAAVVLTLGPEGLIAQQEGDEVIVVAANPVTVINSIGAGDSFLAVFVLAMAQGHSFELSLRAASETGRHVCGQAGSYLSSTDIITIQERMGFTMMPVGAPERKDADSKNE
jgi:ribokinase